LHPARVPCKELRHLRLVGTIDLGIVATSRLPVPATHNAEYVSRV